MSGSLGRLASTRSCKTNKQSLIISSSAYSTFAGGGGRGRGGGRGSGSGSSGPPDPSPFSAQTPGKPQADPEADDAFFPSGIGHGRGKPIPSSPILPSFSSWMSAVTPPAGRGIVRTTQPQSDPHPSESEGFQSKKPIFFSRQDTQKPQSSDSVLKLDEDILPQSLLPGLPGAGRGKPPKPSPSPNERTGTEENRHLRSRGGGAVSVQDRTSPSPPRLSREEAVKKAVGILSQRRGDGGDGMEEAGRGRGLRGRGGRGRGGRGVQGWRGRGGRGGRSGGRFRDAEDDYATGLYLGDNADGERLAKRLGPENMDKLAETFEQMSYDVLPSPADEAYLDALHTNYMIEFEPEYLMGEFDANPDIEEKPPIPLRDALEKVKPFLMAYEGIQSQEEWEEIMKETMEKVPYMKELIDIYSGPDRVTAKQQQEELERVAKTLPDNVPSSVKRFTDRAVLSLQSNPGWGFDKKCQFMDKLVWEVSQQYK